jgi:spoIIIJ-associated protein
MEWVETTGRTVEEALDAALDQLGVHEEDAEYEVLEEPKKGLLGRFGGSDARVRARIRPVSREKPNDRRRRGKGGNRRPEGGGGQRRRSQSGQGKRDGRGSERDSDGGGDRDGGRSTGGGDSRSGSARQSEQNGERASRSRPVREDSVDEDSMPVAEQAQVAADFVATLVEAIGFEATVAQTVDDDVVLLDVQGDQLGLLVGPKGVTLQAIEELARAVVQHESDGHGARVRIDVGGYKAKRRAALEAFTRKVAEQVIESGEEQELEPMSSPDRKVVHDVAGEIEGVVTASEGEDPRRYVVIRPA